MSEFYNYISKIIIQYLSEISLNSGERYSVQLENLDEVEGIYKSLEAVAKDAGLLVDDFIYDLEVDNYTTFYIVINGKKLIVAKTDEKTNADFLTHLRNNVDKAGSAFENTSLLFIHDTNLDSILGGSKRLEVEGMPLHVDFIEKNLRNDVKKTLKNDVDKQIIFAFLDNSKNSIYEKATSIFDFKDLFDVLGTGYIKQNQFKDFGMFYDEKLYTFHNTGDDKSLDARISSNFELFKIVDEIHKYSELSELDKNFEKNGVSKLDKNNWFELDFTQVYRSHELYKEQGNPEYNDQLLPLDNPNYVIWDRAEGESKAKQRKRHLIVFNNSLNDTVILKLKFDATIKKEELKISNKTAAIRSNNKTIEVEFANCAHELQYAKIQYCKTTFSVVVLNVNPAFLMGLEDKYLVDIYLKTNHVGLQIIDDVEKLILNQNCNDSIEVILTDASQSIDLNDQQKLIIDKNSAELVDLEEIQLDVVINSNKIPFVFINEKIQTVKITPLEVWKQKNLYASDFIYEVYIDPNSKKEVVKLSMGTKAYYPTGEFRRLLEIEHQHIFEHQNSIIYEIYNGQYIDSSKILPEDLAQAYIKMKQYFRLKGTLPSLTYYDGEFIEVAKDYVEKFAEYLYKLGPDSDSKKELYRRIGEIGVVYEFGDEKKIHFSPLHPINLAYQLRVIELISTEDMKKDVLSSVNNTYLVPYIRNRDELLFKPIETGLIDWTTYVSYANSKHNASNKYVSRIVSSKINDFCVHFDYLFGSEFAPIKIGVVNLGDCHQVVEGIFEYYTNELKTKRIDEVRPMEIHIYDDNGTINAFEELSTYTNIEEIKEVFNIKLIADDYEPIDILSMYSNKVHFYKLGSSEFEYNHVTFYKMNDQVSMGSKDMFDIETGLYLNGITSDVSSVFVGEEYVTGFGVKNLRYETDDYLKFIMQYNSFIEYVSKLSAYDFRTVLATAIKSDENELLKNIYKQSHWITFIDPKVDLNYFKNSDDTKELMIIHYSDQYSSSNGYDAITVTQKSNIYARIIEGFLTKEANLESDNQYDIREIINSFNVFNGEWLLKLVSRQLQNKKDQYAKEKLSLFAATKLFVAKTLNSDVFWIPISFEEIVRVSGATGLIQKDSIFNPKKFGIAGSFSDDILMIGIKLKNQSISVCYYPIEVKIGNNASDVLNKAKQQVTTANEYLNSEIFLSHTFHSKLLRNQLIQMAMIQLKKIKLYEMWSEKKWSVLLDEKVSNKLINDEYEIVNCFEGAINECGVITFTKNAFDRRHQVIETGGYKVDHLDYPMQDAYKYLASDLKSVLEINSWTIDTTGNVVDIGELPGAIISGNYPETENFETEPHKTNDPAVPKYICGTEIKIIFGEDCISKAEVIWQPNASDKVMHTNTGIIGTMGTGKTQFTKSLITQMKQQEMNNVDALPVGILIFDYKGDYIKSDFVNATNATVYNLYELPFNPLSIFQGKTFKPMLPLHTANELRDTIANAFNLGNVQKNTLSEVLEEAYSSVGIVPHDNETWSKNAPTINTVYNTYMAAEYPTNDSLYAALSELNKFKIFESDSSKTKPLFELIQGVTVINLAGYSGSIQNLVVAITLDTFYAQMQAQGHSEIKGNLRQITKIVLVDEADNFLSKDFSSIKKILKEGREFGVGTVLSTQFLKHFSTGDNEFSQYILTWIIHKVNEISAKEVGNIFSMTNKADQESLVNAIKNLEKHHSIVNLGGDNKPKHVRDKAFWEL